MNTTGRGIQGPGADLLRVDAGDGVEHVAIVYAPAYRDSELLEGLVDEARAFLTEPGIDGQLALESAPEPGMFVYDLRGGASVAEILQACRAQGEPAGLKAALELLVQGAEVLADAADAGVEFGLPCHGDVSPWRLVVDDEGYLDTLGHGLPPLHVLDFLDERVDDVPDDGLRYAPPERLELLQEDILSDLFSLALVAAELIAGEPVFPGTALDILEPLLAGEAPGRIEQIVTDVPDAVLDLLCIATETSPGDRYADADAFLEVARRCLDEAEGPSLLDVLRRTRGVDVLVGLDEDGLLPEAEPEPVPAPAPAPAPRKAPEKAAPAPAAKPAEAPQASAPAPSAPASKPRPAPVPEPEPEDQGPFADPRRLPPLADDADLETVRQRASAVVDRVKAFEERIRGVAEAATIEAVDGNAEARALARRLQGAVVKAEKSTAAAQRSAGLVELDDDASEARVTLGLVTGSEKQAADALSTARIQLEELREVMREMRAEQAYIQRVTRETRALHEQVTARLGTLERSLETLQTDVSSGALSAAGVDDHLARVVGAVEQARAAVAKVHESVTELEEATSRADADAFAETAATGVEALAQAETDAGEAEGAARRAEASGLEAAREELQALASTATRANEAAITRVERARQAVSQGPDPQARALLEETDPYLETAARAVIIAQEQADVGAGASFSEDARDALPLARKAAEDAEQARAGVDALCDRAVKLAGAAAEAAAALNAARRNADEILAGARTKVEAVGTVVQRLQRDTEDVRGSDAVELRDQAVDDMASARTALEELENLHDLVERMGASAEVEEIVSRMRPLGTGITVSTSKAEEAARECREIASDELEDILKERARLDALEAASARARANADRCRSAVTEAWNRYKNLPDLVKDTDLSEARELLKQAFELIDIADFQAGEADGAAKEAARQGDPREAAGYAESAESFWDRISQDLPEAHKAMDEAEAMAMAEANALAEGRDRTQAAVDQVDADREAISQAQAQGEALAAEFPEDKAVTGCLARLRKADDGVQDDVTEVEWARDRAASVTTGEAALEVVPQGEGAAARVRARRNVADEALGDLKKAVQAARDDVALVQKMQAEVQSLVEASAAVLTKAREASTRLDEAVAAHAAGGPEVTSFLDTCEAALSRCADQHNEVDAARQIFEVGVDSGADATALAERARAGVHGAEQALARVEEAVTQGAAAAEEEARARAEAEAQSKAEARQGAAADATKARNAVAAVTHAMDEAAGVLDATTSPEARNLHTEVNGLLAKLEALAEEAESAADVTTAVQAPDAVLSAALDAREAAQRAASASRQALSKLAEARTIAEEVAARLAALETIKAEMHDLAARADDAVSLAKEQSAFLDEILDQATTDKTRALRVEGDEAIANARKAATKVHTALPLVAEAESLEVAEHMLRAARKAVERATQAAEHVPALVDRARERLIEEAEEARRALEAARAQAAAPVATAQKAADKAQAWVEAGQAGRADHQDVDAVEDAFDTLAEAVSAVTSKAREAEDAAAEAPGASSVDAAEAIGARVQAAVDATLVAVKQAANARDALDAAVKQAVVDKEVLAAIRAESSVRIDAIQDALEVQRKAFAGFETEVAGSGLDKAETQVLVDRVEDFLRIANDAVHRSRQAMGPVEQARTRETVEQAGQALTEWADRADETLERLGKGIRDGHDELDRMVAEAAERARQEEEARKKAEEEAKAAELEAKRKAARARPVRGLRPAGGPRHGRGRGRIPRRSDGDDASEDEEPESEEKEAAVRAEGPRARRPSRKRRTDRGADRRLRKTEPDEGEAGEAGDEDSADRRLRRPGRSRSREEESGDRPAGRRLRRPGRSGDDEDESPADRRLRRPSRSRSGEDEDEESPADRRLRRPSRSRSGEDEDESPADRRLRRPSRSRSGDDEGPADRRLRRPNRSRDGEDEDEGPADRRLRRPSRRGEPERSPRRSRDSGESSDRRLRGSRSTEDEEGSEEESRDDVRSRLRERRASRMAGGSGARRGPPERPQRPGGPRGPRGRLPARPGGVEAADDEVSDESGAELLKRRLQNRGAPRRRVEDDTVRSGRSVDDLMRRMRRSAGHKDDED